MTSTIRSARNRCASWLVAGLISAAGVACGNAGTGALDQSPLAETQPPARATEPVAQPSLPPMAPTVARSEAFLTVNNQSPAAICTIRISPTANPAWEENWLQGATLLGGSSYTFGPLRVASYDLRAEFCGGDYVEEYGFAIVSDLTWTVTGGSGAGPLTGGHVQLLLVNRTSDTICSVRISPVTNPYWGDSWLGSDTVPAGRNYTFFVEPGTYDLRAEFCGDVDPVQYDRADLSVGSVWSVRPDAATSGRNP